MGKIILTERQYRNLNQILIGKEIENNKGRLNEAAMTPDEQIIAESIGKKIKYYLKDCAEPQGRESGNWCINKMLGLLKQLKTHEQFDEATKFTGYQYTDIGYGVDRSWTQNLGSFLKMLNGTNGGDGTPVDKINAAALFASYFALAGGTLSYGKSVDSGGNIILTPMSLTLSWKTPTAAPATADPATAAPATVNVIDSTNKITPLQALTAFQHYFWSEYEREDSAPYVSGDKKDECKAKYKSALCGGNPCLKSQAVDGKKGTNTTKLKDQIYADPTEKKKFEDWYLLNVKGKGEYGTSNDILLPAKKCSSADKGYTASVKTPSSTSRRSSTGGGGTGGGGTGGGAPFNGQYADFL